MGLYMVQPYEPGKIPVLLVHGLWSTPMTWMEMFNDLRSQPQIRNHYQFWFYLYPTAQPFWLSAAQLRRDLARVRSVLDPRHEEPALDQMVLIGHSMGGLISRLQTVQSGDAFWQLVSRTPLPQIKTEPDVLQKLQETFFFEPSPSIRRVVTISTPFHGSTYSRQMTQWLLERLIDDLPGMLVNRRQELFRDNPGAFPAGSLLRINTSIDALVPDAPIFAALLSSRRPPWVQYHNIVGVRPRPWWATLATDGDGVVSRGQRPRRRRRQRDYRSGRSHDGPHASGGGARSAAGLAGALGRPRRPCGRPDPTMIGLIGSHEENESSRMARASRQCRARTRATCPCHPPPAVLIRGKIRRLPGIVDRSLLA